MIGDDLVNSYHLLLCCLDLVFGNALLCANRKDLINPTFRGQALMCVFTLNGTLLIPHIRPAVNGRTSAVYWG